MSPDSEYISLIMYPTKHEIDLSNFPAILAVLSILLDTQSNELQCVKTLQQVVDDYYNKYPTEVMSRLAHQTTDIMNVMYDSETNDNFDRVSDDIDRVSSAVDNNHDKTDTDNEQMPYDNDNEQMPYDNDNEQMPYDNDNEQIPYDSDKEQMPYDYDNDNDTATGEMKQDGNMTNDK